MRFTDYKLPDSAYIPGVTSRPSGSPLASEDISAQSLSETSPHENQFFLYGVDLFNHHYFWEAHEVWEEIWHLEESEGLRNLLQGMIQLTGGFLKIIQNNEKGTRTLWSKSRPRLSNELLEETGIQLDPLLQFIDNDDNVMPLILDEIFHSITLRGISPLL